MDIQETISRARKEYQDYLRGKHPEWAKSTLSTYVSDAFYPYRHSIVLSFWKCFESEEAMAAAKQDILDYLTHEAVSEKAEERTAGYFSALKAFKAFLDEKGGVRNYAGSEYDGEATIYGYAKKAYDGVLSADDAAAAMHREIPAFGETSHKIMVKLFRSMMEGRKYTRRGSTEMTMYFIVHIGEDYGRDCLIKALQATYDNIRYYYEQTGNKSNSIRRGCAKIVSEHQIDMDFGETMFEGIIPKKSPDTALTADDTALRYWLYAAGSDSANWERDYAEGIMAVGWDDLGDLMQYSTKEDLRASMQERYGGTRPYTNRVLAAWQFANDIKAGDVIFVKKGRREILGRGVVEGEYVYDSAREHYRSIRAVRWTDKGLWTHAEQLPVKTLTDITPYRDLVKKTQSLFDETLPDAVLQDEDEDEGTYEPYTVDDFLQDVFMDEERCRTLKALLLMKKNVILQGPPGVGKTFAAKRLAYAMMGEKDTSRVQMVQFHQSYSYEDFIMGFRPTETGFALKKGVFYEFCRKAAEDDRPYFFIIDEINRGNLSKIFGELFMLLENDKRGVELQLLYADEQFSIPSNVYIIGMMNTADRSLAMLDYALRRRFAFFDMKPAFHSSGFRAYKAKINNRKFDRLIAAAEQLNDVIAADDSLGEGFCIGHSYFCTNAAVTDDWMKSVVEFELIPLLKEYWFDETAKVRQWSCALREAVQ